MEKIHYKFGKEKYFIKENKTVLLKNSAGGDLIAKVLPVEIILCDYDKLPQKEDIYFGESVTELKNGIFLRKVKFVNYSNEEFSAQISLGVTPLFKFSHWLIPGVMYNGNEFGNGNSPKGMEKDGNPWVFSYDRCTIPSCTLSENREFVIATFGSDCDIHSLRSSCSLERNDDATVTHKIWYPVSEKPVSYTDKNKYSDAYEESIKFYPGTAFEVQSYIYIGSPKYENYGFIGLLESAFGLFRNDYLPSMDVKMAEKVSVENLKLGLKDDKISVFCRDYTHAIGNNQHNDEWEGLTLKMIEEDPKRNKLMLKTTYSTMGFASQGFMHSRVLMKHSLKNQDMQTFKYVDLYLKNWMKLQLDNGLVTTVYPGEIPSTLDVTELGWGASECIDIYMMLREYNMECECYLDFAKRLCEFFVNQYTDERLFGQKWSYSGECISYGGCAGSFMLKAIVKLYAVCQESKYLSCAEKAITRYFEMDMDKFSCSAGAIDCNSVDKESSYPFLYSAIELYKQTGKKKYIAYAHKAAAYFLSWMFLYDAVYLEDCDFKRLGYHTAGGTVVSVEHQCIDPYASIIVPDLFGLNEIDGNPIWKKAGELIWNNAVQCVAGPNGMKLHGMMRLPGMQNECFAQTRWTKYRSSPNMRGHLNDFMGIWLSSFRLSTIYRLKEREEKRE